MLDKYHLFFLLLFILGLLMVILRNKRNWVFGYRTKRSMSSERHFNLANKIAGIALMGFSLAYFLLFQVINHYTSSILRGIPTAVVVAVFFIMLIIYIELRLKKY